MPTKERYARTKKRENWLRWQKPLADLKKAHPERFKCVCSRPGFTVKNAEVVCEACDRAERKFYGLKGENRGLPTRPKHPPARVIEPFAWHLPHAA